MTQHIIQKGLSRGRWANRLGLALMAACILALVVSVGLGLGQLAGG